MFCSNARKDVVMNGKKVQKIADRTTGGIVAGEEEQFHLVDRYLLEKWVNIVRAVSIWLPLKVGG